jgi:hypothetical protein
MILLDTELVRYVATAASLFLAYTAYTCPCEQIYACKAGTVLTVYAVLGLVSFYPIFVTSTI